MANGNNARDRNSRDMQDSSERYGQGSDNERQQAGAGNWQGRAQHSGTYEDRADAQFDPQGDRSRGGGSSGYGGWQGGSQQGQNYGDQRFGIQGYGRQPYGGQGGHESQA